MANAAQKSRTTSSNPARKSLFARIRGRVRRLLGKGKNPRDPEAGNGPGPGERARMDFRANMARMIEDMETAIAAGDEQEAARVWQWCRSHRKTLKSLKWHLDGDQAKIAHFANAADEQVACANYHPYLIEKSAEFNYLTWPRHIGKYIRGRSVLDIGCGFGAFGTAFFASGAASYTGIDPQMPLDSTTVKNKRIRAKADLGMSPRDIMAACPDIRLMNCRFEELEGVERFDVVTLHNVTEHLHGIREILPSLKNLLADDGLLIFHHHNFYCWNGHHLRPNQPQQYDEKSPEQARIVDWNHIIVAPDMPEGHYFNQNLNQIRLDEIKQITEDNFDILVWEEVPSTPATLARFNEDILAKLQDFDPTLTPRDLRINAAFCVARVK